MTTDRVMQQLYTVLLFCKIMDKNVFIQIVNAQLLSNLTYI
jgi:hypothetical protein